MLHILLPDEVSHYVAAGWCDFLKSPLNNSNTKCFTENGGFSIFWTMLHSDMGQTVIFQYFQLFPWKKVLTNHHHMISKKYLNMITYSPNRCVISAICYILVIVGIQINNRLDSKERHESCQFAFERQSEGIDLNPRVMTWKNLLKGSQINLIEDLPCRSLLLPAVLASLGNIVICLLQVFLQPSQSHFKFLEIQVISSL